jgi:hypothetical protein
MATVTAYDIIKKALQKIGVLADGEIASVSEMNDGLDSLNNLLDSWAGRALLTAAQTQESFSLVANQANYTIGANASFNVNSTKPIRVINGFIRASGNSDTPLRMLTQDEYNNLGSKTTSGRPDSLFYNPTATQQVEQFGTLYFYPTPDSAAYTAFIGSEKYFTEFSSLTANVTFPPAYKRALILALAIELAPDYGAAITAELQMAYLDAMQIIETINSGNKRGVSEINVIGKTDSYNINEG